MLSTRMAPELFLKRPPTADLKWRFDQIVKRKAVRFVVIVYQGYIMHS